MAARRERRRPAQVSQILEVGPGALDGTIFGDLPTKSNQRKVYRLAGGRSIFGKSEKALDFVALVKAIRKYSNVRGPLQAATSLETVRKGLRPLVLSAVVYGASWQRDLDVELLPDALQEAGFIENDRSIREKHYWWRHDPGNPRVEFTVRLAGRGGA